MHSEREMYGSVLKQWAGRNHAYAAYSQLPGCHSAHSLLEVISEKSDELRRVGASLLAADGWILEAVMVRTCRTVSC